MLSMFYFTTYFLALFLIYSGYVTIMEEEDDDDAELDPEKYPLMGMLSKVLPLDTCYAGESFFKNGKATMLLVVTSSVLFTDILFAVDSVSAKIAAIPDVSLCF